MDVSLSRINIDDPNEHKELDIGDDIDGLLHDTLKHVIEAIPSSQEVRENANVDSKIL